MTNTLSGRELAFLPEYHCGKLHEIRYFFCGKCHKLKRSGPCSCVATGAPSTCETRGSPELCNVSFLRLERGDSMSQAAIVCVARTPVGRAYKGAINALNVSVGSEACTP